MQEIVDAPLMLIHRIGRWPHGYRFRLYKLQIRPLCITTTKSLERYRTYKTTNRWPSFDAHFYLLSVQHLLSSIIVFIMISLYQLSFCPIGTWPCGKAKCHNMIALFTLTSLNMMCHSKQFIVPAIHLFMTRYSQATSHHLPITYF
jgi:hypothetical protein